ncbi:unnamed protein product [Linum trigynum]|uniref:AB hydrolase-1 domain-containing protein n=1 Tax=Linum trigynum TaxID=586398 RepID=A0AAV2CLP5_9ROSI
MSLQSNVWAIAGKLVSTIAGALHSVLTVVVFLLLDLLDAVFCLIYRFVDEYLEGKRKKPCYCEKRDGNGRNNGEIQLSETMWGRRNVFRLMGARLPSKRLKLQPVDCKKSSDDCGTAAGRWSDCRCESCVSWTKNGDGRKLHVVVREPFSSAAGSGESIENVIFVHGFLASSSYWTETVFPNLSKNQNYRMFAIDLLGFGESPKPMDCLYTLQDHLETIEDSVVKPFQLTSFHIVAHSMGCIIALALAAKYSGYVKSITLVAPPYLARSEEEESSLRALEKIAKKRLWPPLMFGAALMSWYEHLGRCVCFLVCRNHRAWEKLLMLLTRSRNVHFMLRDLTRHTHHSAWHTMHNVICGGARCMDEFLEMVSRSGAKVFVVHGDQDPVVPLQCSVNMKRKFWDNDKQLTLDVVWNADHTSVIMGREKEFTRRLEHIWKESSGSCPPYSLQL